MILKTFALEYICLYLNKDNKQSIQLGDDIKLFHSSTTVEGYLIDEDDEYLYLGLSQEMIHIAINKKQIVMIEMSDPNQDKAEALNNAVDETSGFN